MKDLKRNLILGGLVAVAVVVILLIYTDLQDIGDYVSGFPVLFVIPVLLLTLHNYVFRFLKWQYYLKVIGVEGLSLRNSASLWVSGFVLAISPGKVAELLKAAVLKTMTGTPFMRSAPIIIAERVTDGLGMLVLGAIGFTGILLTAAEQNTVLQQYVPAYLLVLGILILAIIAVQFKGVVGWGLHLLEKVPLVNRFSGSIAELYYSAYDLFRPRALAVAVGLGVFSWAGECVGNFFILWGLGLEPSWLLLWQSTFIMAVATIVGAVSGLPGGLGAAEFSIVGLVQLLVLGYQDPGFAGTAAILIRVSTLWFGVALGLVTATLSWRRLFPDRIEQTWREVQEVQSTPG